MAVDPNTLLIRSSSETDVDQALAYVGSINGANKAKSEAYVKEVFRLFPESGYSPEILVAQWDLETGAGTTQPWLTRNNPGGIGITDGGDSGHSWATPAEAAQAQSIHLSAYVDAYNRGLRKYLDQDPRYLTVLKTPWAGTVKTVADLTGKWATDPLYGTKIAGRLERLRDYEGAEPETPGSIVFDKVPRPPVKDRVIPDADNWAWDKLGQRKVLGIVYHRMLGSLWGTDYYFRNEGGGKGLTDYGIDNTNGEILKWNEPWGRGRAGISPNRSGWASGGSGGESGDGIPFVQKYGRTGINRDLASIEIAGNYESDISSAAYDAIVALSAHTADAARVPWTNYPLNPKTGLTFVYWHNEFQGEKPCPGKVVMNLTKQIINDTKELMKMYQQDL